jgi:hypothetical protein
LAAACNLFGHRALDKLAMRLKDRYAQTYADVGCMSQWVTLADDALDPKVAAMRDRLAQQEK